MPSAPASRAPSPPPAGPRAPAPPGPIFLREIPTPLGPMIAAATDRGVCLLEFADGRRPADGVEERRALLGAAPAEGHCPHLDRLGLQLREYFDAARTAFSVPLHTPGTPFQRAVWEQLLRVPCGRTVSYAFIARALGKPGAVRAVGHANGRNRIAILIPCHRVVNEDGGLGGYGGGVHRKAWLLRHERRITGRDGPSLFEPAARRGVVA